MPELTDILKARERVVIIEVAPDFAIRVSYSPDAFNTELAETVKAKIGEGHSDEAVRHQLSVLLRGWDLTRDGAELPCTEETQQEIGPQLRSLLLNRVMADLTAYTRSQTAARSDAGKTPAPIAPLPTVA